MEHSDAGFGGVGKNRSRAVDEINILAAEIFDRIYNLLCEAEIITPASAP